MAYVLGYWYADGSLEDASYLRGKYIRVTSVDKSTIGKIRHWMDSSHVIIVLKPPIFVPRKIRYFLRIGSHRLYDSLVSLGLYPRKSLTVQFPKIPEEFLRDFIRGYLDGDGCVFLEAARGIRKKKIIKRLLVIFTSGSFDFLEILCQTLSDKLGLKQCKVYQGDKAFQLRYSSADSFKLFEFLYAGCPQDLLLRRKFNIFRDYYALRPSRLNPITARILADLAT